MKIFSLNCWLLPPPFSVNNRERLSLIIDLIKKYNPDIIALQEVWLLSYVSEIKKSFPEYNFVHSRHKGHNKSGLLTGLKSTDFSHQHKIFPMTKNHSILEKFALKGYHHIVLEDGSFFINTHLYTSDGEERKIAEDQFRILREITSAKPGFIVGDLNIDEDRLSEVRGSFGYDISYGFTWSSLNPLTKLRFNKNAEGDRKLDYVLHNGAPLKSRCITRPLVSDHLPLITEFKENYLLEEIPTNI